MEADIKEISSSPWQAPSIFVPEKDGKSARLVVDYRALNKILKKEPSELPRIDEITYYMAGNQMLSSVDCAMGYYAIPH